jgi:hypothetical protein
MLRSQSTNHLVLLAAVCCASLSTVGVTEAQSLRVDQNDERITLYDGNNVVLTYNKVSPVAPEGIDSMYERSGCLHPVCTPEGRTVTTMFPFDHPHQHGVFSAWVKTKYDGQAIDFWNLAGGTGRVLHEQVASVFQKNTGIGFEVDLIHRAETEPKVDVLRERWRITAYPTDGTYRCFDLQTTQSAITSKPLTVSKYHYGGIVLRGPTRWLTAKDRGGLQRPDLTREPSGFLNNLGSDRIAGNHQHAKWVALWGEIEGQSVSITVLCHRDNFRAPQAARLHPSKPYFCFAPCVEDSFVIDKEHPFQARYRYLVTDARPDPKWLDKQWDQWCGPSR